MSTEQWSIVNKKPNIVISKIKCNRSWGKKYHHSYCVNILVDGNLFPLAERKKKSITAPCNIPGSILDNAKGEICSISLIKIKDS